MKRIIFNRQDSGVSVVVPAPQFVARFDTEAKALQAIIAKDIPSDALNVETVNVDDIPSDRTFRDAWTRMPGGRTIGIDMKKAREIHAQRIAATQGSRLVTLKLDEHAAQLAGRTTDAVAFAAKRAALESLDLSAHGARIANAANPTALSAVWPVELE